MSESPVETIDPNFVALDVEQGLLGDDGDGTVDGTHPTDLGFHRQAQALLPVVRSLL